MRALTPSQVLTILIQRMEKRASALEGVRMNEYNMVADELRKFAQMARRARDYVDLGLHR